MSLAIEDVLLAGELERVGYDAETVAKAAAGRWSAHRAPEKLLKTELVNMLIRDGHRPLADRVMDGEFDG